MGSRGATDAGGGTTSTPRTGGDPHPSAERERRCVAPEVVHGGLRVGGQVRLSARSCGRCCDGGHRGARTVLRGGSRTRSGTRSPWGTVGSPGAGRDRRIDARRLLQYTRRLGDSRLRTSRRRGARAASAPESGVPAARGRPGGRRRRRWVARLDAAVTRARGVKSHRQEGMGTVGGCRSMAGQGSTV